ncbi:MAG: uroporphyrinogen-III C-methyltransferase [Roseitalea sp.]|jgi:uroporphyrin-III C-methyltransferase/precorrin-2 dehydrogenase/sirohydrochlorin ferrochelatase|nr:uroporphyrinogen-III C-methyltransferase [Roseitalea sp.]MBO6721184.1 uroporphyrinogen-III C-methyltransferase [Roseitalea sp.]MBO6744242.1 uroporphyrinogen-III C-methyltransferase [Roseitalea sp.]
MRIVSSQPSKNRARKGQERIGDLAVLPVFYKLKGKHVLVAGGTDAAAWKAHLLAAAGAFVEIYAAELDPAFESLLDADRYRWHRRTWAGDSFNGMQIAIADARTDGEAQAFYCAARAAGVPVNVIDKPAYCEFQFGSIVNRSPAIVSISTDGAAPILGQAIRRRIETLLPKSLQRWAQLARDVRADVSQRLIPAPQRRVFWEGFVDRAFSGQADVATAGELIAESERLSCSESTFAGRVTLVGAGPGDAELLTLKAVRALQAADVILFDDLVSPDVLELARREAKRMLVGKRGGRESCKQDDINEMMVTLAKSGKHVIRLKGGDPMIFGRGGEETARLQAENIPVNVVPGITSALAMAASLGVSLTHRDFAQSVRFVTGHSRKGALPMDIDWRAVADPTATTIFYMGARTAAEIAVRLTTQGLSPQTPVVIVSAISRPEERRWRGTIGNMKMGSVALGYEEPVLIGVGQAFRTVAGTQSEMPSHATESVAAVGV